MRPPAIVVPLIAVCLTLSSYAGAQDASSKDDLATLEKNLATEHAALSTADCATACKALASIRRAAERICALDPDERCTAARAKADDATRRVRDACPDCALASAPIPAPKREERAMGKGGASPVSPAESPAQVQSAPASEAPRRGGCASCTTSGTAPGDLGVAALAIAALAFALRRRPLKPGG